ncbi:hypothetical protein [Sphaerisporangium album]|uniref:hypothetical protein n=1 Tax=Sphaerisporangium album TaxID=509200 RepID=UPI0015F10CBF|nr:hypothetical protein [Sphaerisporangium album]
MRAYDLPHRVLRVGVLGRGVDERAAAEAGGAAFRSDGPLLVIGGGRDHTVPEVVAKAAYELYGGSSAVTDYQSFPDRGHSLVFDHGWREIADFALSWLRRQGF